MSFRLGKKEPVHRGVARIARERLDDAVAQLAGRVRATQDERVHTARRRLKQLRAVARLVRDELGGAAYRRENVAFRDAARPLSAVRDARVAIETLDALLEHFADEVEAEAFAPLRRELVARSNRIKREVLTEQRALERAATPLRAARKRIGGWKIADQGFDAVAGGLRRVYGRGARAMRRALGSRSDEDLHQWRKRAKYLRYQVRILSSSWRPLLDPLENELHRLTDALGDDHDLAVLSELAGGELAGALDRSAVEVLRGLVRQRRGALQKDARKLGERIYAEDADDFVARMEDYWGAWR